MTTDGRHLLNGGKLPLIAPDLLGEILATASDVALLVAPSRRVISVLVNPHHRSFGQLTDWEGAHLKDILTEESLRKVEARINEMHGARHGETAVELNHADQTNWEFPVRYSMHRIGADDQTGADVAAFGDDDQRPAIGAWRSWHDFFPWEDWRAGRPAILEAGRRLEQRGALLIADVPGIPLAARIGDECIAIDIDDNLMALSLREGLRIRPAMLARCGWKYSRIHELQLFLSPDIVADRLIKEIRGGQTSA